MESINELKKSIVAQYTEFGDEKGIVIGCVSYSGNETSNEVEKETELKIYINNNLINLNDFSKKSQVESMKQESHPSAEPWAGIVHMKRE